jgi:hypothetical protein
VNVTDAQVREWASRGRISQAEADRVLGIVPHPEKKPSKYRNVKTEIDGITFDSKREANRYLQLALAQKNGRIRDLRMQYVYPIVINGVRVCDYRADFRYEEFASGSWVVVVEDAKGLKVDAYILKKKLMLAVHGITIKET